MLGHLIGVAAQPDTSATCTHGRLKNHGQADLRGSAINIRRIHCQAISRYWNAGVLEQLTLNELIAASFNRSGVRSR
ncbi:hypothetical protein X733_33520 [Mesorhizobium sp. L2C067A000]|nr:hypothetical protein X733_33520 [Mesorhizobium sp. L2C067A000]